MIHRGVHPDEIGKLQAIGTTFATETRKVRNSTPRLTQAGMDPQPVPSSPRIVFWEPAAADPQPVAVLLDSSEPMWRSRPVPTEVADPGSALGKHYELAPTPWLDLVHQGGGDDLVSHIVPAPGGQRALIALKSGSRGKRIRLRCGGSPSPSHTWMDRGQRMSSIP